jgi:hypothetical protein
MVPAQQEEMKKKAIAQKKIEDDAQAETNILKELQSQKLMQEAVTQEQNSASKFEFTKNIDHGGDDIQCFQDGSSADKCKELCLNDTTCKGYNYIHPDTVWGSKSGCCYKNNISNLKTVTGIDFYALKSALTK